MSKKEKRGGQVAPEVREFLEPLAAAEKTARDLATRPLEALGIPYPVIPGPTEMLIEVLEKGPEAVKERIEEAVEVAREGVEGAKEKKEKRKGWGM